ncbi:hypothetical protein J2793_006091 [Paraburkholderia caledonica]|uniref:Uncharacterized protein n=1 Tax=Paraburkholderia caledonica TaxID=134536 RepID=A0AB73IKT3_9BURK|nr:hypothetical protein [Paraburkholderia caledonica]
MWFRAVATAIAVWCASGAAMAAGYTEVWNPPEASAHGKHGAVSGQSVRGGKGATKSATKDAGKHAAPRTGSASAAAAGHSEKSSIHGGVKRVAATGTPKASGTAEGKSKHKVAVAASGTRGRAQVAQTQPAQSKATHGATTQSHAAGDGAMSDNGSKRSAAKTSATIAPHASAPSPNTSANQTAATADPATARSGSLPPILH